MRIRTSALLVAASLLLASTGASASQPPDEEPLTPCEEAAIGIAQHATTYTKRANQTDIPFELADNTAKACGVTVRGIKELTEMSCPQDMISQLRQFHDDLIDSLNAINEHYEYRFSCFVPEFG